MNNLEKIQFNSEDFVNLDYCINCVRNNDNSDECDKLIEKLEQLRQMLRIE